MERFWFKFVKISLLLCTFSISLACAYWLLIAMITTYGGWATAAVMIGAPTAQFLITYTIWNVEKLEAEFESEQAIRRTPTWLR